MSDERPVVIKIGGNELEDPNYIQRLAQAVTHIVEPAVVVHGGGRAIGQMQAQLGLSPKKIDGLRVTDGPSLAVAQMVLSGDVNKRITAAMLAQGLQALGISGVDGGLLRCRKKKYGGHDLGRVGEIMSVNARLLALLLSHNYTPVVSPISLGLDGAIYNVNADEAAGAIASGIGAKKVWFISNVEAVLDADRRPYDLLTADQTASLIAQGVIEGGMVPKVSTALKVVQSGVREAVIASLEGLVQGNGTRFVSAPPASFHPEQSI